MQKKARYLLVPIFVAVMTVSLSSIASAADARNFNAGRIIDDAVFTNSNSMTVSEIQNFLDSKVTCDTWGAKKANKTAGSSETRAQWMKRVRGLDTPLRCISTYKENPNTGESNYSKATEPVGAISAAQIIYNYSKQFNINPQVILVTLQKENSLILDEWPNTKQFREAMGFGCPDNVASGAPACDPNYGSFSSQVYQAARHFRGYIDNKPGWWVSFNTGWNDVGWNPVGSCGAGSVYIENRATVALYSYTPYQPNQAAKNAQYGTGDSCSSYGNRNFYMYFTDWFGSVYSQVVASQLEISTSDSANNRFINDRIELKFTVKNPTNYRALFKHLIIAGRDGDGANIDPVALSDVEILPGSTKEVVASYVPKKEGNYQFFVSSWKDGDEGWRACDINNTKDTCFDYYPILNKPIIGLSSVDQAEQEVRAGTSIPMDYFIENTSNMFPLKGSGFRVVTWVDGDATYEENFPSFKGLIPSGQRHTGVIYRDIQVHGERLANFQMFAHNREYISDLIKVKPATTITKGLGLSKSNLRVGEPVEGTFEVKNSSTSPVKLDQKLCYIIRDIPQNGVHDFGCLDLDVLGPGEIKQFSRMGSFSKSGKFKAYFSTFQNGIWKNSQLPLEVGSEVTSFEFEVKP